MKNEQKSENDTMLKKKITFYNFTSCDIVPETVPNSCNPVGFPQRKRKNHLSFIYSFYFIKYI